MPRQSPHACCWGTSGPSSDPPRGLSLTQSGYSNFTGRYLTSLVEVPLRGNINMDWFETVRKAETLAEAKGYVTFDELNQILPPIFQSEDIEAFIFGFEQRRHMGSR